MHHQAASRPDGDVLAAMLRGQRFSRPVVACLLGLRIREVERIERIALRKVACAFHAERKGAIA